MKAFSENLLEVVRFGEFEQYSGGSFRQTETSSEVEFIANIGRLVQAEVVRRGEQEGPFGEEPAVIT